MSKVLYIGRCYGQPAIEIKKGMSLKELEKALKALEGHEVTTVSIQQEKPAKYDPW